MSLLFLKLGIVAFGGPARHTAMLETEVVAKRNWLSADSFLELMSITNLIPGPNSSELVMAIGYRRYGIKGLFVAGISFLLPAMMMVIAITVSLSWFDFDLLTTIGVALTPVIAIIILKALFNLIKKQEMDVKGFTILVAALILKYFNVDEFLIIIVGAIIYIAWNQLGAKLYSVEPFSREC
ncbi:chromate transporter [Erysipelothrix sp. D19-032]